MTSFSMSVVMIPRQYQKCLWCSNAESFCKTLISVQNSDHLFVKKLQHVQHPTTWTQKVFLKLTQNRRSTDYSVGRQHRPLLAYHLHNVSANCISDVNWWGVLPLLSQWGIIAAFNIIFILHYSSCLLLAVSVGHVIDSLNTVWHVRYGYTL